MTSILLLLFFALTNPGSEVNYFDYHRQVNAADSLFFIDNNHKAALHTYDQFLGEYSVVFVRDYYLAAQIACQANDKKRVHQYLKACFDNGLNIEWLTSSKVLATRGFTRDNQDLRAIYTDCRKRYLSRINYEYRGAACQLYAADQIDKNLPTEVFYKRSEANMDWLITQIKEKGFPSDKVIGLDDSTVRVEGKNRRQWYLQYCMSHGLRSNSYVGYEGDQYLASTAVMPFLVHHPCAYQRLEPYLYVEIKRGNVHPRDVALLYDNRLNLEGRGREFGNACTPVGDRYYKIEQAFIRYPQDWRTKMVQIDSMRAALAICSMRQDPIRQTKLRAYGFHTQYGFWDCR